MAVEFLSNDVFEALPENKPAPKTDEFWDPIIDVLGERKIVKIPFADEKEKRGRRLSTGRRSKKVGFPVELRYGDDFIAVRRANNAGADATQEELSVIRDETENPQPRRRRKIAADAS